MSGGSGSTQSTSSYSPTPAMMQNYMDVVGLAKQAAATPYTPYGGQLVAPLSPTQEAGISNVNDAVGTALPGIYQGMQNVQGGLGAAMPYYNAATGSLQGGFNAAMPLQQQAQYGYQNALNVAQPYQNIATNLSLGSAGAITPQQYTPEAIQQYMSPYMNDVVNATMAQMQNQQAQQRSALQGNAISQGAFGGDRAGIAQAELANQQNLSAGQTLQNLLQGGYLNAQNLFGQQQGVNLAAQQANRAAQAAAAGQLGAIGQQGYGQQLGTAQQQAALGQQLFGQGLSAAQQQAALGQGLYGMGLGSGQALAGLGTQAQTAALQGAQAQLAAGAQQQAYQQALNSALQGQFQQQQAYPFQSTQYLANIIEGIGAGTGGTSTATQPGPNVASQIFGGLGALSLISDPRMKDNMEPVGKTFDGQNIYKFNYKGSPTTHIGLNAAETEHHKPEAVSKTPEGIRTVNYDVATADAAKRGHFALGGLASMGGGVVPSMERQAYPTGGSVDSSELTDLIQQLYGKANPGIGMIPYGQTNRTPYANVRGYIPSTQIPVGKSTIPNAPNMQQDTSADDFLKQLLQTKRSGTGGLGNIGNILSGTGGSYGFATGNEPGFARGGLVGYREHHDGTAGNVVGGGSFGFADDSDTTPDQVSQIDYALGKIESGHNSNALGPLTGENRDRAYGYSQVMGANIPNWTKEILGTSMTPDEYLKNPNAQKAVTRGKIAQYLGQGYSPQDVASMWFSGKPMAQAGNASDVTGTTVPDYIQRFNKAYGSAETALAQKQGLGAADQRTILENIMGRDLDPNVKQSLLAGFLGMMASKSPYFGSAIGEGGIAGIANYQNQQQLARENALAQAKLQQEQQRVGYEGEKVGFEGQRVDIERQAKGIEALKYWQSNYQPVATPNGIMYKELSSGNLLSQNEFQGKMQPVLKKYGLTPSDVGIATPTQTTKQTEQTAVTPEKPQPTGETVAPQPQTSLTPNAFKNVSPDYNPFVLRQKAAQEENTAVIAQANGLKDQQVAADARAKNYRELAAKIENGEQQVQFANGSFGFIPEVLSNIQQKKSAEKFAEDQAATQTEFNKKATDFLSAYDKDKLQLDLLSNIYSKVETNRASEARADLAGWMREFGIDKLAGMDVSGIQSANDSAIKAATTEAFTVMREQGASKAPATGLREALLTVASPTLSPGSKYQLVTNSIAEANRDKAMYEDWILAGKPDKDKFTVQWKKDPAHQMPVYQQQAVDQTPLFKGMDKKSDEFNLLMKKPTSSLSEPPAAGGQTPSVPKSLIGVEGLTYSPTRKQYKDKAGNIYDETGKKVQ